MTADQRVANFLLAHFDPETIEGDVIQIATNRAALGSYLALSTETVCRVLSEFTRRGLIEVDERRIRVLEPKGLEAITQEPMPTSA